MRIKKKTGSLDILFINKNTSLNYDLDQKSLNFISEDNPNTYKGTVDFKPFHFSTYLNYDGISTKNIFDNNSIFVDLFESEMLLNKNLSANLDLNVKDITNINELNNLNLKMMIEEGDIKFSDSFMMWKDDLKIKLNEGQLVLNDEGINMIGTFIFDFKDINDFYSSFQIKKIYRKNIKQIEINFLYNFNSKSFRFDNPRINNIQDMNLDQFLNDFNSKNERVFNKITFKNFVSDFFQAYEG